MSALTEFARRDLVHEGYVSRRLTAGDPVDALFVRTRPHYLHRWFRRKKLLPYTSVNPCTSHRREIPPETVAHEHRLTSTCFRDGVFDAADVTIPAKKDWFDTIILATGDYVIGWIDTPPGYPDGVWLWHQNTNVMWDNGPLKIFRFLP